MIDNLRHGIPTFRCKPGCHDCCGPVPTTAAERSRMGKPPEESLPGHCAYATEEGCACYEERPLMCRLFGAVENLRCPRGCGPPVLLTAEAARMLLTEYADSTVELTGCRQED